MHFRGLGPDEPYWTGLSQGRLTLPRCQVCGRWHWPAVSRCGACGSWAQEWRDVTLEGRLFTWTRTWHSFLGAEGLERPFVTAVIELPQAGNRRVLGLFEGREPRIGLDVVGAVRTTNVTDGELPVLIWRGAA